MKQHRLMVLGSMDEFVELVKLAKAKGIYTVVCDGYPDGPAKAFADESYTIDVRKTQQIADLCRPLQIDGVIASFSDLLAECLVDIADAAGLPCYAKPEPFRNLREKLLMKEMLHKIGAKTAESVCVRRDSIEQDLAPIGFPCVIKPVNGYGSRGIYRLDSVEEVAERFDEVASYSSFDHILAERCLRGHEFNMMNWIVDGEVVTISIADRETSTEFEHVIPHVSRCAYPSRLIDQVYDDARAIIKNIADYVGISFGPLSMQFFWDPEEGVQVCEAAGRLFGYEHELVTMACGLSIEEVLLNQVYDHDALRQQLKDHSPFFTRCSAGHYFHGYEGVVADISKAQEAASDPRVVDTHFYYLPGEEIRHGVGAKPYVLRCYVEAPTRAELDEVTERLYRDVQVLDAEGNSLLYGNQMTDYEVPERS